MSIFVTSFFYMAIGTIGYAAFGDAAPGNLLTGTAWFRPLDAPYLGSPEGLAVLLELHHAHCCCLCLC